MKNGEDGVTHVYKNIQHGKPLVKSAYQKIIFLFLNQNICCGYSKEPSQRDDSFVHPKTYAKTDG